MTRVPLQAGGWTRPPAATRVDEKRWRVAGRVRSRDGQVVAQIKRIGRTKQAACGAFDRACMEWLDAYDRERALPIEVVPSQPVLAEVSMAELLREWLRDYLPSRRYTLHP